MIPVRQRIGVQRIRVGRSSETGTDVCTVHLKLHTRNGDIVLRACDDICRPSESHSASWGRDRYGGRSRITSGRKRKISAEGLMIFRVS